jgi:PadR family transcriptional regulator, regulatory protein PadR
MNTTEIPASRKTHRKRMGTEMWQSQLRKGSLDLAVLASLSESPLDRQQICDRLEQMAGIAVVQGVIYPVLRRLRGARWIEIHWVEVEVGHPRQLFRLTVDGREHVSELIQRWRDFTGGMNRMLDHHGYPAGQ